MSGLVVFEIGVSRFAFRRDEVARILPAPRLTRPPSSPPALAGFFAFGSDLVTVLSFQVLAGIANSEEPRLYDHLVLLRRQGFSVAIHVNRVVDVLDAEEGETRALSSGSSHRDCVVAEIQLRDGPALVVETGRLVADYERRRVIHFADEERRRRASLGDAA